ncbi:MAG TPA: hypothetical protein VNN10_00330 [Dehalococcoidia bacterium]|nr:hypothetical protein [Dehalococcoidia bacterium]
MSGQGAFYFQVKAKCLSCGLHFIVCTHEPERHGRLSLTCPECRQAEGSFAVWRERVAGFIFQTVPGGAVLVEFGLGRKADS